MISTPDGSNGVAPHLRHNDAIFARTRGGASRCRTARSPRTRTRRRLIRHRRRPPPTRACPPAVVSSSFRRRCEGGEEVEARRQGGGGDGGGTARGRAGKQRRRVDVDDLDDDDDSCDDDDEEVGDNAGSLTPQLSPIDGFATISKRLVFPLTVPLGDVQKDRALFLVIVLQAICSCH